MRLAWPFHRETPVQRLAGDVTAADRGALRATPGHAEWRQLPPLEPTMSNSPLLAPPREFKADLAGANRPAPMLQRLGHERSATAPHGLVSGLATVQPAPAQAGPIGEYRQKRAAGGLHGWLQRAASHTDQTPDPDQAPLDQPAPQTPPPPVRPPTTSPSSASPHSHAAASSAGPAIQPTPESNPTASAKAALPLVRPKPMAGALTRVQQLAPLQRTPFDQPSAPPAAGDQRPGRGAVERTTPLPPGTPSTRASTSLLSAQRTTGVVRRVRLGEPIADGPGRHTPPPGLGTEPVRPAGASRPSGRSPASDVPAGPATRGVQRHLDSPASVTPHSASPDPSRTMGHDQAADMTDAASPPAVRGAGRASSTGEAEPAAPAEVATSQGAGEAHLQRDSAARTSPQRPIAPHMAKPASDARAVPPLPLVSDRPLLRNWAGAGAVAGNGAEGRLRAASSSMAASQMTGVAQSDLPVIPTVQAAHVHEQAPSSPAPAADPLSPLAQAVVTSRSPERADARPTQSAQRAYLSRRTTSTASQRETSGSPADSAAAAAGAAEGPNLQRSAADESTKPAHGNPVGATAPSSRRAMPDGRAVQRAEAVPDSAPAATSSATTPAGTTATGGRLDDREVEELLHRLYPKLRTRLAHELLVARERSGLLTDLH